MNRIKLTHSERLAEDGIARIGHSPPRLTGGRP